jgi:uncharacterized protein
MKKILVISFLFATVLSANAQDNASYKATLKKMLESAGSQAGFQSAIKQMFTMFRQQKSNVPAEVWNALETEMEKTSIDDLTTLLTPVYQKQFTEADLKEIIKFYETPIGKKYAGAVPVIMQESMQVGQEWGMKIGQDIMQKIAEKGY